MFQSDRFAYSRNVVYSWLFEGPCKIFATSWSVDHFWVTITGRGRGGARGLIYKKRRDSVISIVMVLQQEGFKRQLGYWKTGGHFVCACVKTVCWSATEASSINCLRSLPAFAGRFLELNDVYWVLRSTNVFFKVSRHFYDQSEFIVASLSPLRGQSFLS